MDNVAPQPVNMSQPKPGMSGCLKALIITAAILVFCMLLMGFVVWRTVSWVQNAVTPAPTTIAPLSISAGEKQDIDRILRSFHEAKQGGTEFDEYMTPNVFNGVMEEIFKAEKQKGNTKTPAYFRASLDGDKMKIQLCAQADDGGKVQYFTGEAIFNLEIENGEIKNAVVHGISANGREAPNVIMWVARSAVQQALEEQKKNVGTEANELGVVKLLRLEKDRLHVVLDGKKIKD